MDFQILVTHFIDPLNFWAHIYKGESYSQFGEFEKRLHRYHQRKLSRRPNNSQDFQDFEDRRSKGSFVLVNKSGKTFRAIITCVNWEEKEADVIFYDYGYSQFIRLADILLDIPTFVTEWPKQAWHCALAGIQPITCNWLLRAINKFSDLVLDQLKAVNLLRTPEKSDRVSVDILHEENDTIKSVAEILVDDGCGMPTCSFEMTDGQLKFDFTKLMITPPSHPGDNEADRDFEEELLRSSVPSSHHSIGSVAEGTDLDIGSSSFPSTDVFESIQSQIERCKLLHFSQTQGCRDTSTGEESGSQNSSANNKTVGGKTQGKTSRQARGRGIRRRRERDDASSEERQGSPGKVLPFTTHPPQGSTGKCLKASGEGANVATDEKLKNELDWKTDQLVFKLKMIIKSATGLNTERIIQRLKATAAQERSQLKSLGGKSEIYHLIDTVVEYAISAIPGLAEVCMEILDAFCEVAEFNESLSAALRKASDTFVQVPLDNRSAELCTSFGSFLGHLYVRSEKWNENGFLTILIIDTIEKWTHFQQSVHQTGSMPIMMKVFIHCLCTVLKITGPTLSKMVPSEMCSIKNNIKKQIESGGSPEACRNKLKSLLTFLETYDENVLISETSDILEADAVESPYLDKSTQTDIVKKRDLGIHVNLPTSPAFRTEVDNRDPHSVQFCFVKTMLDDLEMRDLFKVFTENAIRDALMKNTDATEEVKQLLKECGILPGQVLEIMMYAKRNAHKQLTIDIQEPATLAKTADQSSAGSAFRTPDAQHGVQPVQLISPQQFESSLSELSTEGTVLGARCVSPSPGVLQPNLLLLNQPLVSDAIHHGLAFSKNVWVNSLRQSKSVPSTPPLGSPGRRRAMAAKAHLDLFDLPISNSDVLSKAAAALIRPEPRQQHLELAQEVQESHIEPMSSSSTLDYSDDSIGGDVDTSELDSGDTNVHKKCTLKQRHPRKFMAARFPQQIHPFPGEAEPPRDREAAL